MYVARRACQSSGSVGKDDYGVFTLGFDLAAANKSAVSPKIGVLY